MATWTKHDKDIDSPILVSPYPSEGEKAREFSRQTYQLTSYSKLPRTTGNEAAILHFFSRHTCQFQREQPMA